MSPENDGPRWCQCKLCGKARGLLTYSTTPNESVLICPHCDNVPNSEIPNAHLIRDVRPRA